MRRAIVGFRRDEAGDWVADLSCLHSQHVRHQPPFRLAPWVLDDSARAERVGTELDCPACDRAELPDGLHVVRRTEIWDEQSMPAGLRRAHRLPAGAWGRLQVEQGELRFRARTDPPLDVTVGPQFPQAIPPEVEHDIEPGGAVRFFLERLRR